MVEEALQALLAASAEAPRAPELPSVAGGRMPGVDYASNASMFAAVEHDEELRRQSGLGR